ncbi:MAG: 3-hydroxyacyl-ACP dehydratase FabZ family protein [Planctomycetota bacterium]
MRFLLLDRITSWHPGRSGTAVKNVALSEDFFDDHFPLKPIMPGVLMLEGMAQLSGLLLEEGVRRDQGRNVKALMSMVERAKFRRPSRPGDSLEYSAEVRSVNDLGGKVSARASAAGEAVADCSLIFSFHEFENARLEARRDEILSLWTRDLKEDERS